MNLLIFRIFSAVLLICPLIGYSQILTNSTNISITKTWSSNTSGYTYPISITVPSGSVPQGGFPVCILLHGNGSQNLGKLAGPPMLSQNQFGSVLNCHILVAPTGFENSWNICAENSDAPDVEMINDLINNLQTYTNVNPKKIRVLGTSNGAGLANRIFIENKNSGLDIVCAVVSPLNDFQYHSGNFYKPSGITDAKSSYCGYDVVASPLATRKYLSISNANDPIIPYLGGTSVVGANFLPAETAAFNIATFKGYSGSILTSGTTMGSPAITEYSYLSGNVVHIKGTAGHAADATEKGYIKGYFSNCVALPIVLLSFSCKRTQQGILLNWSTANEVNSSKFIIQQSIDGSEFNSIGTVKAIGSGSNSYEFTDNNPANGIYYYRLQIIDKDGSSSYSKAVSVNFGDQEFLSISPNPVKDFAIINFSKTVDKATIAVYDITGKTVLTQAINSTNAYKLNTQTWTNGVYKITVHTTRGIFNAKLLINK